MQYVSVQIQAFWQQFMYVNKETSKEFERNSIMAQIITKS